MTLQSMTLDMNHARFCGAMTASWVSELAATDSRLEKEKIIEKALMSYKLGSTDAQAFLFNCYQAYNPFYTFGVRRAHTVTGHTDRANDWPKFWALLESLRTRSVTGNRVIRAIEQCSQHFNDREWNTVCMPVILKDLRCGVSEKTLNRVLGRTEWRIPVFECQLATDSADHVNKLVGSKLLECKLDGVRVLAVIDRDSVSLFSRNGKRLENFDHIEEAVTNVVARLNQTGVTKSWVLDGEIVGQSFQQLMKQTHRKINSDTQDCVYHVFDIIPLHEFKLGHCNAPLTKRRRWLEQLPELAAVRVMPNLMVDLDTSEGHDQMHRFAEQAVQQGFEGIMIKEPQAPYECRRSSFWLKWKPVISVDLTIVGFEPGTGRNRNRLGAMICEGTDNGRSIRVNVGSGFSDSDRDQYWLARNVLLGNLVEIQADAVTQNQDGSYSLRFPRFKCFRDTGDGEKM